MTAGTLLQIEEFFEACTQCLACLQVCELLENLGLAPGEIADQVMDEKVDGQTIAAIKRCDLCGLCSQSCPEGLNPSRLIQLCRQMLVERGQIQAADYDLMEMDRNWNFFSLYRSTFGIQFDDLYADKYDTLFFSGCSLSSYAPELTHAIYAFLKKQKMRVGFTEMCCGKPLTSIGYEQRTRRLLDGLREQMRAAGARRLITACPNCLDQLQDYLGDFELVSLYEVLLEAGVELHGEELFTVHDSCPNRYNPAIGQHIRALLRGFTLVEMAHHGKDTICCGSGGIVSMVDPDLCTKRAEKRMSEFTATGADRCVTACMACSHRLARTSPEGRVTHLLELIFNTQVDYARIAANIKAMWEGEWGEYNLYCLSTARLMTERN